MINLIKLYKVLESKNIECAVILGEPNLFYFTEYQGAGGLVICNKNATLVVPLLEKSRAEKVLKKNKENLNLVSYYPIKINDDVIEGSIYDVIEKIVESRKVGIDKEWISSTTYDILSKKYETVDISKELWEIRSIKEDYEIERIKKAGDITKKAMEFALDYLSSNKNITELELAGVIDMAMKKFGASDYAFPSIVAFGENSAEPHHIPSSKILDSNNDIILFDIGAKYNGYCFDSTRSFINTSNIEVRRIYESVLEAQLAAIDNVREGVNASELDALARKILEKYNLSKYFIHSLGHGVGIQIHEYPLISLKSKDMILKKNMVITIEPGVYLENLGIRIEDTIIVTNTKPIVLETTFKYA
jgi:Xaa-Pro dipeptidase